MDTDIQDMGVSMDELHAIVRSEIDAAIDFIEMEVGSERAESTKYYRGDPLGNEEDGRSQIVTRDVRDAVRQVLPSIMEVFFGAERAVEFVPHGPEDVAEAEQATDYVNYVLLQDNPGFEVFHSVFKDSLYNKAGIVKYWLDESVEVSYHEFSGLNDAALGILLSDPTVEPTELVSEVDPTLPEQMVAAALMQGIEPPMIHHGTMRQTVKTPRIRIAAVPPEEFLIDRNAKSIEDARYVGHRTLMAFSDLVALGYDPEVLKDHIHSSSRLSYSTEVYTRYRDQGGVWPENTQNESEQKILYIESWVRVDRDGDGIGELTKICTIGEGHEIVQADPVDERPFASFCPDPEPHLFFGNDIADQTKDIQKIRTMVTRAVLDSLAQSIHPRTAVVEGRVNIDDALNTEMGSIIRQDAPGMVQPFAMPFVGAQALPVLEMLEAERDRRIGIHNMALDADALQSTTKAAVTAQERSATQNLRLIARLYAESGMRRLFRGVLKLLVAHQDRARMVRLRNEWVQVDPRSWSADMDVSINVGLGHGLTEDRQRALGMILQSQYKAVEVGGIPNPLVTLGQIRNTVGKMAELAGYKDTSQFFKPLPVNYEPPPPQPKPSAEELLAQVEREKTAADIRTDAMKADLDRDKLLADIALRARELEMKYGEPVDWDAIRNSIDTNRLFRSDEAV